jgi:hypothetical protein
LPAQPDRLGGALRDGDDRGARLRHTGDHDGAGASVEIVEDGRTGFLADDADGLLEALGKVGTIDRATCRAAVEGHFSAGRMVAEHVALYERVLAGTLA